MIDSEHPHTELLTPTTKLVARLKGLSATELKKRRVVILVSTGSFCPVHRMHVQIFQEARKHLEQLDFIVLGGFLSPSHDSHIIAKLGDEGVMVADHRIHMCQLMVQASDWVAVSAWEACLPMFYDLGSVTKTIRAWVQHQVAQVSPEMAEISTGIEAMYLAGADLVTRCRMWSPRSFGIVGMHRPGFKLHALEQEAIDKSVKASLDAKSDRAGFFWVTTNTEDVSSTKIRKLMVEKNREGLERLTSKEVVDYLLSCPDFSVPFNTHHPTTQAKCSVS